MNECINVKSGGAPLVSSVVLTTDSESTFTIATIVLAAASSVDIDWGDGNSETLAAGVSLPITHDYTGSGASVKNITFGNGIENITTFKCDTQDDLLTADISELTGLMDLSISFNDFLISISTGFKPILSPCKILIAHNPLLDESVLDMTQFKDIFDICNFSLLPLVNSVLFSPNQTSLITNFKFSGDSINLLNEGITGILNLSMFSNVSNVFSVNSNEGLTKIIYPVSGGVFQDFGIQLNPLLSGNQDLSWSTLETKFAAHDCPLLTGFSFSASNININDFRIQNSGITGVLDLTSFGDIGGAFVASGNDFTNILFPASSVLITEFNVANCNLTGTFDVSNINLGGNFRSNGNPLLTGLTFPSNSNTFTFFDSSSCDLTGIVNFSGLTGVATFVIFSDNANLTGFVFPASARPISQFLAKNCNLTGVLDLSNFSQLGANIQLYSNSLLTGITMPITFNQITIFFAYNCNLTGVLNLSGGDVRTWLRIDNNPLLTGLSLLAGLRDFSTEFDVGQTAIDKDYNLGTDIISSRLRFDNCGMSQLNVDTNINDIYDNKGLFGAPKQFAVSGTNPDPTGIYDGITDWSLGLPTSPMAKVYDMENNITGTYNFNFTDLP